MRNLMKDLLLVFGSNDEGDTRIWVPSPNSVFSSKSFYSILTNDHPLSSKVSMSNLWNSTAPPRVKAFSWISFGNKILWRFFKEEGHDAYLPFYVPPLQDRCKIWKPYFYPLCLCIQSVELLQNGDFSSICYARVCGGVVLPMGLRGERSLG